ncbi:MAG TPA: cupin domain-containing protein [Steroidobacteraceae bacterium]
MLVKRFADAKPYEAPNHHDLRSLRLQGFEPNGPKNSWVGLSHFLPGGSAGPDSSPLEKVYVVLAGSLMVRAAGQEVTLGPLDSCCIASGETREVRNLGNEVATMIVVMPYPAPAG